MSDKEKKSQETAPKEVIEEVSSEETEKVDESVSGINADETAADGNNEELENLKKEIDKTKENYARVLAEYDNYRKRTSKEKIEAYGDATIEATKEMLPVLDNFERAMLAETTDENFKNGMQMIFNQYFEALTKLGVSEIEAEGKEFDPNFHNAINQVEDENFGENTVCQVMQKGYKLGDKVIRHAMVVVANP
ncbi:MAG: nucleotide exchange factor GrpE [Oscillospiraceae bacterium]